MTQQRTSSSRPTGTSSSRPTCSRPACPKHLRDRGGVGGGLRDRAARRGRRHGLPAGCTRPGFEGWTISRYRQTGGRTPEGDPEIILEDMDLDGVDVQVMHPNLSLFGLYSDDHELSIAHARVYNDYVIERFTPYFDRIAPTAPIPLTDIDDAVAEIERVAAGGFRGDPAAGDPAAAVLLARPRPGVGRGAGQRRAACSSTRRPAA